MIPVNRLAAAVCSFLFAVFGAAVCDADSLLPKEITFQLAFASNTKTDRGYVDVPITDKSIIGKSNFIEITFECDNPKAVGALSFYLHSGKGWYTFSPESTGDESKGGNRFIVTVNRSKDFRIEDTPAQIEDADVFRFAIWRGASVDASVKLLSVRTIPFQVFVVKTETKEGIQTVQSFAQKLNRIGIAAGTIAQNELTEQALSTAKIVVLPLNSDLTKESTAVLKKFVENGGKLIAFYQLSAELKKILGFEEGQYLKSPEGEAAFAEVRFDSADFDSGSKIFPLDKMQQKSWNIVTAKPLKEHNAEVAAYWYDKSGKNTGYPALLLSDRGAYFSHILLDNEDPDAKNKFLVSLFGHFAPSFLHQNAVKNWQALFAVGDNRSRTDEQRKALETLLLAELKKDGFSVEAEFFQNGIVESDMLKPAAKYQKLNYVLAAMRTTAIEKYCASLTPKKGEFRAWWEHAGLGAYPGDWDRTMKELSEAGFNAVIPNLLWGGSANYASDVIQRNAKFEKYGDQVEQAVKAGKKYGVEVHAWQVCYRLTGSTREFIDKMETEGRTQVSSSGEKSDWLCPSHPKNIDLETDTLCELVRKYPDLAGIHFDYIRYPDGEHCYCPGCKERFVKDTNCEVEHFPKDVRGNGKFQEQYEQWRCEQITKLVERVHRGAKQIRPNIKISAAVFSQYPSCRRNIGQDWVLWVEKGYLDFICPMDYTENLYHFEGLIEQQQKYIADKIPVYPGIGATATGIAMSPDRVAAEIEIVRKRNAPGFTIFNLSEKTIQSIPPMLKLGATRP
jgi:uncharacterized lipoprotein YddW (UPF0748 family)